MGEQMTYRQLLKKLRRYQRKYKRRWFRADYMACWKRGKGDTVEMRVGWHCTRPGYGNSERLLLLHEDGRVTISAHISMAYERYRLNHYFPFNKKWHFWWWRGGLFISQLKDGEDWWENREKAIVIDPRYYNCKTKKGINTIRSRYITFDKNGEPVEPLKGMRFKTYKRRTIKENNRRYAPRKRGWFWTKRARNIYRDTSKCVSRIPWEKRKEPHSDQYYCRANRWEREAPRTWSCGCVTYRKTYKRPFSKTVKDILDEPNATVRAAWMQIYGIQKFFLDAGAETVESRRKYDLLRLRTGTKTGSEARRINALKMTCPTTGTVYINSVPDNIDSVERALDWMYDVRNYFSQVGQQT